MGSVKVVRVLDDETREARADFVEMFDDLIDAVEFEDAVLSSGREFLPECAQIVLDGGAPTAAYWRWLQEQANNAEDAPEAE